MRIFISYAHDNPAHVAAVLALAQRLREAGYDAWIDQFEPDPQPGWAAWTRDQIARADRVLLVPTEAWLRRFHGHERGDVGKGVRWEGALLTDRLYHARPLHLRAVIVGDADPRWIPAEIGTHTFYRDADELLRHLGGAAAVTPAPLPRLPAHPVDPAAAATRCRAELESFLLDRFAFVDLDNHLARLGLDDLRRVLPNGHHVGLTAYVTALVDAMVRRGALADRRWWDLLRAERPVFAATLDALQAAWG